MMRGLSIGYSLALRGAFVATLIGASATAAKADDPVTIQDPTANSTVTLPGTQTTIKVKFKINDNVYTFSSVKLLKQESNG